MHVLSDAMSHGTFSTDSVIRGHHVYKDVWTPVIGEELMCQRELGNLRDPFAVSVLNESTIIGHVPRKISVICSMFLQTGGTIDCIVFGNRQYSRDLVQGGLEVPCELKFVGDNKHIEKVKKLMKDAHAITNEDKVTTPPEKKLKLESAANIKEEPPDMDIVQIDHSQSEQVWLHRGRYVLTILEKEMILQGDQLNDQIINVAQQLLHKQFPHIVGLQLTLRQSKKQSKVTPNQWQLQIIHCKTNYWIVASTLYCTNGKVNVYDSLYDTVDEQTKGIITGLFGISGIDIVPIHKQQGTQDCGLYSIAVCVSLAFKLKPELLKFDQSAMRSHLVHCIESENFVPFPEIVSLRKAVS